MRILTGGIRKRAGMHIAALDHALSGRRADMVRMHLCWGNYEGPHHRDVPLADVIDLVMKRVRTRSRSRLPIRVTPRMALFEG